MDQVHGYTGQLVHIVKSTEAFRISIMEEPRLQLGLDWSYLISMIRDGPGLRITPPRAHLN